MPVHKRAIQAAKVVDVRTFAPAKRGGGEKFSIHPLLYDLLTIKTPHPHEWDMQAVILGALHDAGVTSKKVNIIKNNMIVYVGGKIREHGTMFSCHMDTVHHSRGKLILEMDAKTEMLYARDKVTGKAEVLGADDKVGVYIMLRMIKEKIPGVYVFHVGEEVGCVGSKFLSTERAKLFSRFSRCIAFDRKDYTNVITHQRSLRCCSEEFAVALAAQLNLKMPPKSQYKPDPTGLYTDSASYQKLIPECTNLSVGYFGAHGNDEHIDPVWLENMLLPAIFATDWKGLPTKRDPAVIENRYASTPYQYGTGGGVNRDYHNPNYGQPWTYGAGSSTDDKWKYVTKFTTWVNMPMWNPKDGMPDKVSRSAMELAILKYMSSIDPSKLAKEIWEWHDAMEWSTDMLEKERTENLSLKRENHALRESNKFLVERGRKAAEGKEPPPANLNDVISDIGGRTP